jgi:hypothetical protein
MLVEVNDGGLGVGAELALGGAGRITGLQRMSATQMLAALFAMAAMDREFADDRFAWDLGLELLIERVFDDIAAAVGTVIGQGSVEGFVNLFGLGRLAMSVLAVGIAFFATGLLGFAFRLVLGKGCSLPFGRAFEFFNAFLELRDEIAKLLVFEKQLFVRRRVHANLDSDKPCQLYEIIVIFAAPGKMALNKHGLRNRWRETWTGHRT